MFNFQNLAVINIVKILQAHGCAHGKLQMLTQNKVDRMKNRCLRSITNWPEQSKPDKRMIFDLLIFCMIIWGTKFWDFLKKIPV